MRGVYGLKSVFRNTDLLHFIPHKFNMAFTINGLLTVCIVVVGAISVSDASGLQCFSCSSLMDSKCGVEWGYGKDGGEGDKYLVPCEGLNAACKKIQSRDSQGGNMVVTRSCWQTNTTERYTPPTECEKIFQGKVCYCSDVEPCNGGQLLQPLKLAILVVLSPLVSLLF